MDIDDRTESETADHAGADAALLARLRAGEEAAFTELVDRYHSRLTRLAASFGARGDLVQDIAQETWLAALRGLDRFEGRSPLQSWLFQICANRARTMTAREQRVVPLAPELFSAEGFGGERAGLAGFGSAGFGSAGSGLGAGWPQPDKAGEEDERAEDAALAARIQRAIAGLAGNQGRVVALRDAQGMSSAEVCELLSISEANQRVLLHRGRARVRAELARR